jgi:hypothetical protein
VEHNLLVKDSSIVEASRLPGSGIRVLSIDAGGVRCLCPLVLLQEISKVIRAQIPSTIPSVNHSNLRPENFLTCRIVTPMASFQNRVTTLISSVDQSAGE